MKANKLLNESKKIEALARKASNLPLAKNFANLSRVRAFCDLALSHGYNFVELCVPINGYSVNNEADQVFQFCHSIIENESYS